LPIPEVACAAFAPEGDRLLVRARGGVQLHDLPEGRLVRGWPLPGRVLAVAFSADGRHFATANADGTAHVFRLPER
jgi:hypothetical protein